MVITNNLKDVIRSIDEDQKHHHSSSIITIRHPLPYLTRRTYLNGTKSRACAQPQLTPLPRYLAHPHHPAYAQESYI